MSAQHTPGPWKIEGDNIYGPNGQRIADVWSGYEDEIHADARLIAAAPELLAALREMVAGDAEAIKEAEAIGIPFPDKMLDPYQRAVSAIAKATGEAA